MLNHHKLIRNQTVTKAALVRATSHNSTEALNTHCMYHACDALHAA